MAGKVSISVIFSVCVLQNFAGAYRNEDLAPIGVLLEDTDRAMDQAITFQTQTLNSGYQEFRLTPNVNFTDMNNAYDVIATVCSSMKRGVYILLGKTRIFTLNTVTSYAYKYRMPFVSLGMPDTRKWQEYGYDIYMKPLYADALYSIIEHKGWNKILYVYDSLEGLHRMQQLKDVIVDRGMKIHTGIRQVRDVNHSVSVFKDMYLKNDGSTYVVVLDLPASDVARMFAFEENKVPPWTVKFHFLYGGLNMNEIGFGLDRVGFNMTGLSLLTPGNKEYSDFNSSWIRAGAPSGTDITVDMALAVDSITMIHNALGQQKEIDRTIFQRRTGSSNIDCHETDDYFRHGYVLRNYMKGTSFAGVTGIVTFDEKGLRKNYKLDVMEISRRSNYKKIGEWSNDKFTKSKQDHYQTTRPTTSSPSNQKKGPFKITSILSAPFLIEKVSPDPETGEELTGNDRWEGFCVELAEKLASELSWEGYEIETVKDGNYGMRLDNGSWNGMVGELINKSPPFLMRRPNYLRHRGRGETLDPDKFEGFVPDFVDLLAKKTNLTFEIHLVRDGLYGSLNKSRMWNGMVGEVMYGEADLAIAPLTITAEREEVIDFSKPFMGLGISIMILKPEKSSPGVFSFMTPLSEEIWMCVIFAYIGVSVVLFLVSRFSPFEWHIEDNTDGPSVTNNFTIFNSLWFSLGAFMQQGCDIEPRSMSGRIVGSVWWFFTLIIISSYTANLAAFLTVERMQTPIESADDLAKQTDIKYGSVESGSTTTFFKKSSIPVYERMWSFMMSAEPSVFVHGNDEGIARVRSSQGRYAFLAESTTIEYNNQQFPCNTMKVGSNLDSKGYGIGTPIGSELGGDVNLMVLQLREAGELRRLENKWWYDKGQCGGSPHSGKKFYSRDEIALKVLELRESGELKRLEKKWWYDKGQCGGVMGPVKQPVTTSALEWPGVKGIFYILFAGLILGVICAAIEFLCASKKEAERAKDDAANSLKLGNVAGLFYILLVGLVLAVVMAVLEFIYKSQMEAKRRNTTFMNALRSKARLSIKGKPDSGKQAIAYTYAPAAQLVSLDGYADNNAHTQV